MTSATDMPAAGAAANHGANLAFRSRGLRRTQTVRLPNSRVGIEAPTDLEGEGPVILDDTRQVTARVELALDAAAMRYKVTALAVVARPGDELEPELLRQLRWAEMVAAGVENAGRVVTFAEDGSETRHRSELTLTADEQVAAMWLQAKLAGVNPNVYIAGQLGISKAAAAARVKRVRDDAKIIPAATQGQRH